MKQPPHVEYPLRFTTADADRFRINGQYINCDPETIVQFYRDAEEEIAKLQQRQEMGRRLIMGTIAAQLKRLALQLPQQILADAQERERREREHAAKVARVLAECEAAERAWRRAELGLRSVRVIEL